MKTVAILITASIGLTFAAPGRAQTYSPLSPDADTLVLYHFNEPPGEPEAIDASQNNRNADYGEETVHDAPSLPGLGTAYSPAGSQKLTFWEDPSSEGWQSPLYKLPSGAFTIEMWVKFNDLNFTGNVALVTIQSERSFPNHPKDGGPLRFFDYTLEIYPIGHALWSGALSLGDNKGPNQILTRALDWEPGQWYHIAVTFEPDGDESGVYRFYRSRPGDPAEAMPFFEKTARKLQGWGDEADGGGRRRLLMGYYPGLGKDRVFPGQIDELRISTRVRTSFPTPATP